VGGQVLECVLHLRGHVDRQYGRKPPELRGQPGLGVRARPGMSARTAVPGGAAVKVFDLLHRRQVVPRKPVGPGQLGALSRARRETVIAAGSFASGPVATSLSGLALPLRRTASSGGALICSSSRRSSNQVAPLGRLIDGWTSGRPAPAARKFVGI
jgi:hypothetical protein